MADAVEMLTCRWCKRPVRADRARWWDDRPECPDQHACQKRSLAQSQAPLTVLYRNHAGQTAVRRLIPRRVWFGATEWHPEPQWLLDGWDVDRDAERTYALRDFLGAPPAASDPEVRGGEPCVLGTRVPVADVAALLADGLTPAEVHDVYPTVTAEAASRVAETPKVPCGPLFRPHPPHVWRPFPGVPDVWCPGSRP